MNSKQAFEKAMIARVGSKAMLAIDTAATKGEVYATLTGLTQAAKLALIRLDYTVTDSGSGTCNVYFEGPDV